MTDNPESISIEIEVAYGLPHRQMVVPLVVSATTTAREAALASGLDQHFEGVDLQACPLGVFGTPVDDTCLLKNGDRLELYRPLLADPREVRRQLAEQGKTMGKKRV